ncbi:sensor histidine kinase [Sulfurimonas sp. SAG-AH-194-C20]|nr:sensor histidine kinase [Sulfurimonas sp. SAG-AH-194-C20]MDF1878366.1 sensor histidine kinase [Sulfurimonas sp. SAG-AH-194-C20]
MLKLLMICLLLSTTLFSSQNFETKLSYYFSYENISVDDLKNLDTFVETKGENFGLREDYCYLKLELKNRTSQKIQRYFEFSIPFFDKIELYDEDVNTTQYFGQLYPFRDTIASALNAAFNVDIEGNSVKVLYLKLESSFAIKLFLEDFSPQEYHKHIGIFKNIFIFIYGMFTVMLIYNLFILFFIRTKAQLYYVLFHFMFYLGVLAWTGFGFEYIWPKNPIINFYSFGVLSNIAQGFNILMIINTIDLQKISPRITKVFYLLSGVFFFLGITAVLYPLNILYGVLGIINAGIVILGMSYLLYLKFHSIVLYAFLAKLVLILSYAILVLSEFNIVGSSLLIEYGYVWGGIIELILMSFVIMYKYKNIELAYEQEQKRRRNSEELLLIQHKLSMLGVSFNALVHQWRQPFSMINSIVFKLFNVMNTKDINRDIVVQELESIEDITKYMSESINDFRNMFTDEGVEELVNIRMTLYKALDMLQHSTSMSSIEIIHSGVNFEVQLYSNDFFHLLTIVLNNAVDAINISGKTHKTLELIIDNKSKIVKIQDSGNGLSLASEEECFKLFHTTKSKDDGSGVGLYIAKVLAQRLNIEIDLYNTSNGCCFEIKF